VLIGDREVLAQRARTLGLDVDLPDYGADPASPRSLLHVAADAPVTPGTPDPANAPSVLRMLDAAVDGCMAGRFAAMVTAPVHKGVINDAGISFTGHTEYLAARTGGDPVMMLTAGTMRVALATTHLPLAAVPAAIDIAMLSRVIRVLNDDLVSRYGIEEPRILILGLNPHAGEGGHLGREEIEVITPCLERMRAAGINLTGPVPADSAFTPALLGSHDAVLAMYHDQGLPVLKHAGFGSAVNVTLGLPIIRTSVDHGTALDLAGSGRADAGSLRQALAEAVRMAAA